MRSIRTDLAVESAAFAGDSLPQGVTASEEHIGSVTVHRMGIHSDAAAEKMEKPRGNYATLSLPPLQYGTQAPIGEAEILANELRTMLPERGSVLVVGLGNRAITPDAVGPLTADKMLPTRHIPKELRERLSLSDLRTVSVIQTGVTGKTGIETAELATSVCHALAADAVVAVDALAAGDIHRLGCTVQIADSGISPGSGVQNSRKELSRDTLGVPVLAVGIPTVVDGEGGMMVTPREIDAVVRHGSSLLALGLNLALQPTLTPEEILGLTTE